MGDSHGLNLKRERGYTIAKITVNLPEGLGLRETQHVCLTICKPNIETFLIKGDTKISLSKGVFGVPYPINKGEVVEVRVKGVGKEYDGYITRLCEYLSGKHRQVFRGGRCSRGVIITPF